MKMKKKIPYQQIDNGALILLLLRESKTWNELCERYVYADPAQLINNTATMMLRDKLFQMRELGLINFTDEETEGGKKPVGEIKETGLWAQIRGAFGGMSLSEVAMISRSSTGMAVTPAFGRPRQSEDRIDVFVLMPFNPEMEGVYTYHIKKLGDELGIKILRADDMYTPGPFMDKVWDGICRAQLIIADCTQKNPNVFYEIGMAHTVGKQVVLITRSNDDIPSDIKHYNYIPYEYDPVGVDQLIEKLRTFMKGYFEI